MIQPKRQLTNFHINQNLEINLTVEDEEIIRKNKGLNPYQNIIRKSHKFIYSDIFHKKTHQSRSR